MGRTVAGLRSEVRRLAGALPLRADDAVRAAVRSVADPLELARTVGVEPDRWQAGVLATPARQLLLLCCRQAGKSTVSSLLAVDEVVNRAPALVLILAPALRQAQELFRMVRLALHALGPEVVTVVAESALALETAAGSRVISLPGTEATVRGFSAVDLLIIDEAARVRDDLYFGVRPMLAVSGGRIALLSTPFGKRGFFHAEHEDGGPDWHRVTVTARDCPRIAPAWLEAERARIGEWWYRQEYGCEFVETDDQVFGYDAVMGAIADDVAPLFGSAA